MKDLKWRSLAAAALLVVTIAAGVAQTANRAEAAASGSAGPPNGPAHDVESLADAYKKALAKAKGFEEWKDAQIAVEPLGPGTHSWLATLTNRGKSVGYLVISAMPGGGYKLTEYGTGGSPLFGAAALHAAAERYGFRPEQAAKRYAGPELAAWRVKTRAGTIIYVDAVTGERIEPLTDKSWGKANKATASASLPPQKQKGPPSAEEAHLSQKQAIPVLAQTILIHDFDPYERMPWLTRQPLNVKEYKLELRPLLLKGRELRLVSDPIGDGDHLDVRAVAGSHEWSDDTVYLALHNEGLRWLSLSDALRIGRLYA